MITEKPLKIFQQWHHVNKMMILEYVWVNNLLESPFIYSEIRSINTYGIGSLFLKLNIDFNIEYLLIHTRQSITITGITSMWKIRN